MNLVFARQHGCTASAVRRHRLMVLRKSTAAATRSHAPCLLCGRQRKRCFQQCWVFPRVLQMVHHAINKRKLIRNLLGSAKHFLVDGFLHVVKAVVIVLLFLRKAAQPNFRLSRNLLLSAHLVCSSEL